MKVHVIFAVLLSWVFYSSVHIDFTVWISGLSISISNENRIYLSTFFFLNTCYGIFEHLVFTIRTIRVLIICTFITWIGPQRKERWSICRKTRFLVLINVSKLFSDLTLEANHRWIRFLFSFLNLLHWPDVYSIFSYFPYPGFSVFCCNPQKIHNIVNFCTTADFKCWIAKWNFWQTGFWFSFWVFSFPVNPLLLFTFAVIQFITWNPTEVLLTVIRKTMPSKLDSNKINEAIQMHCIIIPFIQKVVSQNQEKKM